MTDRELLTLAAKAAGMEIAGVSDMFWKATGVVCRSEESGWFTWRPLHDDGDALRLAVKLKLDLRFPQDNDMYVDAGHCDGYTVYLIDSEGDRAAATRRAIVRAAADIGATK